ncbi:hypothetical protein PI125_g21617 [Phytophthora idaei]|nr:hypothetical protein PI125_g21617 [Phytophthora idaei]KAG3132139.1 hypothetical protein PI126_g19762 [Phytophthora idaei]
MPEMVDHTSTPSSADDTTLVVWVTPQLEPFSCECVHTMETFYRIKKSCNWWARDMDWINQDWMKVTGWPVEFFADETASAGKLAPEAKQRLAHLASEVSAVFATVCFRTKFYHKDSTKGIYFEEVVGYVAGHAWLNNAVVSYVSDVITASQVGVHVLSSFVVDNEKFPSPPQFP